MHIIMYCFPAVQGIQMQDTMHRVNAWECTCSTAGGLYSPPLLHSESIAFHHCITEHNIANHHCITVHNNASHHCITVHNNAQRIATPPSTQLPLLEWTEWPPARHKCTGIESHWCMPCHCSGVKCALCMMHFVMTLKNNVPHNRTAACCCYVAIAVTLSLSLFCVIPIFQKNTTPLKYLLTCKTS